MSAADPHVTPSVYMMCPPEHFDVTYAINPYMDVENPVDRDLALREWTACRDAIVAAGAKVVEQQPQPGLPDLVFTRNSAFVYNGKAMLSRFRFPERQGETPHDREALEGLGLEVHELPKSAGAFEGSAEAMPFAGKLVCGHGYRTDLGVLEELADFTGLEVVPVELTVDPRYYHLDVAFCPLDAGTCALVNPFAMPAASLDALLAVVPDPIMLTEVEANAFCANSVAVGSTVLLPMVNERLADELASRGLTAVEVPVTQFMKAGGAIGCMTLRLDEHA